MASFDPATATAAYMATLSPAAHAKATAYTQGGHWLLLWGWVVSILAYWIIIRSGLLARAEERIERKRPHAVWASFAAGFLFLSLDWIIELPWGIYARWFRERQYGLSSQAIGGWFGEEFLSFLLSTIFLSLFLVVLYALIRRAPKTWWVWGGGLACFGFVLMLLLAPVFIEPLFNRYTPAPPGSVRDAVVALAQKAGVPHDKIYIYNGSKQSNRYTANVSGLGPMARVAMSDTMFRRGADLAEVRAVVAHEMGHYKLGHLLRGTVSFSILALAMLGLTQLIFPYAARWLGADVDSIADPAGLPVIAAVIATLFVLALPVINGLTRLDEAEADAFSYRYADEPDGLARALVKTIEYRASSPSDLEEFIFYDHPSVEHRVRAAMNWKAAHPPTTGGVASPSAAHED